MESSSLSPPERKKIPGTAGGTQRESEDRVAEATWKERKIESVVYVHTSVQLGLFPKERKTEKRSWYFVSNYFFPATRAKARA